MDAIQKEEDEELIDGIFYIYLTIGWIRKFLIGIKR